LRREEIVSERNDIEADAAMVDEYLDGLTSNTNVGFTSHGIWFR